MAEDKKSPLQGILDIYEESVAKQDEKGYADLYKKATEALLKGINEHLKDNNKWKYKIDLTNFTFEDINYGDGYFIFGMGTNTTIDFHVKELPGWLFGIWWNEPKEKSYNYKDSEGQDCTSNWLEISCDFFCQYEDNIDKFKPTRSPLCVRTTVTVEKEITAIAYDISDLLVFMYKEPELAFCRDYMGWDYNVEYHTRAEAKKVLKQYTDWSTTRKSLEPELDNRMIVAIKKLFEKELEENKCFLQDRGENWSPRYEIIINKDLCEEVKDVACGCYGLSDFFKKSTLKELHQEEKACEKIATKANFCWDSPVSECVYILDTERYNKIKNAEGSDE